MSKTPITRRLFRWTDERLGASSFARKALDKIFPDHWSFMVGEIAMYCFVILIVTGVYLTFFFVPASDEVIYHGPYKALEGTTMSAAYESSLDISFEVRSGLVMRQMHHWAALIFMAALVVHLCRVFFTGAFRRPREINWIIGVTLFVTSMMNGFFGYSLLDDLLSGTGVRVGYSIALSIPVAGEYLAFLFFGGEFPNTEFITRFFVLHVLLLPAVIAGLLGAHLAILWRQKHTQFKGPGRTEDNIEGSHLWPSYAAKSIGLFFIVTAVIAALGGLAQINPVWLYGPYDPAQASAATAGSQPDWYVGWLDGALRIMPGWEVRLWGHTIANPFFPGAVLPGFTFGMLYIWPFLERRFTKDKDPHNLLDRPRDAPVRSALGAATLTFYTILFIAGGNDVLASVFKVAPESITNLFRILIFVAPVVAFFVTRSACRSLAADKVHPFGGTVGARVRRTPTGGYELIDPDEDDKPKVGSVLATAETSPFRPPAPPAAD